MNAKQTQDAQERKSSSRPQDAELLDVEPQLTDDVRAWLGRLREALAEDRVPGAVAHIGHIRHVADGVATVTGLPEARFNELLRFPGDVYGLVFNLDPDVIGCVLLGEDERLSAGDSVRLTGRVASVPVGEALLGRVVDALGRPLDGEGGLKPERLDPVDQEAPALLDRAPVEEQLLTGIKAIDALIPIGRGQRELVVGDRATGKTAIAVDTILSQRRADVVCVYAAIGQKQASVKRVAESLRRAGMLRRTIIVSADAEDAPGLLYLAPYAATTMAEYFMAQGQDALVIYDDLTRHARAYREISLLLRRPPGREAYPGDIFFIHSRLLERATHYNDDHGGGSLTALPIVETQAQNISAYIPTNLISITDGQIFLDADLFHKGIKPAIHAGKSVSRVGGKTQLPAIRTLASQLRLAYAQFSELEIFTRFGATVEQETRNKIERGRRVRELLKQQRLQPLPAADQVLLLLAVDRNLIDRVPVDQVARFEAEVRERVPQRHDDTLEKAGRGEEISDEEWDTLERAVVEVADAIGGAQTPDGESASASETRKDQDQDRDQDQDQKEGHGPDPAAREADSDD